MLKNPLISIFGMRPRNIEVNDFVKKLSTPCSSRAILQTSAGFLGKWYSNDSGFNPLGIYINIVMTSIGYIESEIPFEIHSGEGQVGQSVSKWNAVSTSFFDERKVMNVFKSLQEVTFTGKGLDLTKIWQIFDKDLTKIWKRFDKDLINHWNKKHSQETEREKELTKIWQRFKKDLTKLRLDFLTKYISCD